MRKFIILFFGLLLSSSTLGAFANNIEILPTMRSKSNVQDRVWSASFQLAWNNFMDKIANDSIRFPEGTPTIVYELNRRDFMKEDLSKKSYYFYTDKVKKNTKNKIARAIKRKFGEKSDLIQEISWEPRVQKYAIYSILQKDLNFKKEFKDLGFGDFNNQRARFFGINTADNEALRNQLEVLFYDNENEFAVQINCAKEDSVILYKTSNTKPFNFIYADLLKKKNSYNGYRKFLKSDLLSVPYLDFYEEISYEDIAGRRIKGTNFSIEKALTTVKFTLSNKGIKLKNEALMTITTTSLSPEDVQEPRNFNFNSTFVVFLKEIEKEKPYFALRVCNISNFQK